MAFRAPLALVLLLPALAPAQDTSRLVGQMRQLRSAPQRPAATGFDCAANGDGHSCRVRVDGYPQDVKIFFTSWPPPKNARRVLYLHGWHQDFDTVLSYFKFDKLLAESGSPDTVLIVPDGAGPNKTDEVFAAEWRSAPDAPQRFRRFVASVEALISGPGAAAAEPTLVLAGHSGAGSIMDRILSCRGNGVCYKPVSEVYLIDGAYSPDYFDAYAEFARTPGRRFVSVFYGTADGNDKLRRMIDSSLQPLPGGVSREELAKRSTAFVKSDVDHMATVGKYLPLLLAPAGKN